MACYQGANTRLQNPEREVRHFCGRPRRCVGAQRPDYGRVRPAEAAPRATIRRRDARSGDANRRRVGADHAFNKRILPRRTRRPQHFFDAHLLRSTPRLRPIDPITIPNDESRRGIPRPRLAELLRGPRRGRMRRDVHVDDAASLVR
jgi:hypothetical protein